MPNQFHPEQKSYSLAELKGQLLVRTSRDSWMPAPTVAEASGVIFLCPKCYHENHRETVGVHSVICWFNNRGVPADATPGPGRWNPVGTGINNLTFVAPGAYSVLLTAGCKWHGFVQNGEATVGG